MFFFEFPFANWKLYRLMIELCGVANLSLSTPFNLKFWIHVSPIATIYFKYISPSPLFWYLLRNCIATLFHCVGWSSFKQWGTQRVHIFLKVSVPIFPIKSYKSLCLKNGPIKPHKSYIFPRLRSRRVVMCLVVVYVCSFVPSLIQSRVFNIFWPNLKYRKKKVQRRF